MPLKMVIAVAFIAVVFVSVLTIANNEVATLDKTSKIKKRSSAHQPIPENPIARNPDVEVRILENQIQKSRMNRKQKFTQDVLYLTELKKYPIFQTQYKKRISELSKDLKTVWLASQILTDLDFTIQHFNSNQSLVRLFSVEILGKRSQQGDMKPLEFTIQELSKIIKKQSQRKGQEYDFIDLLSLWLDHPKTRSQVINNPEFLFQNFHYHKILRRHFVLALHYSLGERMSDLKFHSKISHLLKGA